MKVECGHKEEIQALKLRIDSLKTENARLFENSKAWLHEKEMVEKDRRDWRTIALLSQIALKAAAKELSRLRDVLLPEYEGKIGEPNLKVLNLVLNAIAKERETR